MLCKGQRRLQGKLVLHFPSLSHSINSPAFEFKADTSDLLPGTLNNMFCGQLKLERLYEYYRRCRYEPQLGRKKPHNCKSAVAFRNRKRDTSKDVVTQASRCVAPKQVCRCSPSAVSKGSFATMTRPYASIEPNKTGSAPAKWATQFCLLLRDSFL